MISEYKREKNNRNYNNNNKTKLRIFSNVRGQYLSAVLAGNDTVLKKNITQDRKRLMTQSKHMIF